MQETSRLFFHQSTDSFKMYEKLYSLVTLLVHRVANDVRYILTVGESPMQFMHGIVIPSLYQTSEITVWLYVSYLD